MRRMPYAFAEASAKAHGIFFDTDNTDVTDEIQRKLNSTLVEYLCHLC